MTSIVYLCNSKIHSTSTTSGTKQFLEENIRVKPDLDALGALGDLVWYCIGALLWTKDYELPTHVHALPDVTKNSAGVILSCTASLHWDKSSNKTSATIHCSFLSHTSMDITVSGSRGSVNVFDFIIPYQETSASFDFTSGAHFAELHIGWNTRPEKVEVATELPQEALMVAEFARLVGAIRTTGSRPDSNWPQVSRKTQLVMDAVQKSIDSDCKPVYL